MIRRLGILFVLALTLAACTGAERDAVAVGDAAISRGDLVELLVALNPGGPDEVPATLSAGSMREIANQWALDAALETVLAEQGVVVSEGESEEIDAIIANAVTQARVGELAPQSAAFEALQRNLFVASRSADLDEASRARLEELLDDVDVESRLGITNPDGRLGIDPNDGRLFVDPNMPIIVPR